MALSIAASHAAGMKANFGTMTKPLHVGQCGRNGLLAALLAEGGFDGAPDVFEHHQGFLNVFNGPGTFNIERLFENWASPLEIEDSSIGLKQFPCCGSTHPAITAALNLAREENIKADDIAAVEILPHARRLRHTNTPQPQTSLAAKFSVQYVVARAFTDKAVRLKHFEGNAHLEPEILRLLAATTARPHPDMPENGEKQWGAEVNVTLKNGRKVSRLIENLLARGGDYPMSDEELWEKFEDCAERSLPRVQVAPLFERLETLDKAAKISDVTLLLQTRARTPASKVVFAKRGEHGQEETAWVP
jgi:2-methylcitrate dehydratase PrpD